MSWIEDAKDKSAKRAVDHLKDGMIVGLGSGSTATKSIKIIGRRLDNNELSGVLGIPTSYQASEEAIKAGIPLTTLDEHPEIDLGIDGADQIDKELNLIKGGGAALLREKIIAAASKKYIIIADKRKITDRLGKEQAVPLEVYPISMRPVIIRLRKMGVSANIRVGTGKLGPVITDNGNMIIDADFGEIEDPVKLDHRLHTIPGVLETGLFIGYADKAYIGEREGVETIKRK